MDDVILITTEDKEMQKMLNITDQTAGKYHIEFGKVKSQAQALGNLEKIAFKLGEMTLDYTNSYKYLGHTQNTKNNLEDHLTETRKKVEAAYQTILAIAGNSNFKGIELEVIWALVNSCIASIITYSLEATDINKTETKKLNQIMDNIIKRILMIPTSTPREPLYIETGLLDAESMVKKNESITMYAWLTQQTNKKQKK